ncbi:MAG: adenylate/guanylate cyclase domain-containing protein, partial [Deltaproteobacteria bacterium]|nr:adenylate/guanylate cyclase domain-containing protein [Deltaproteobacteria bacterium]
MTPDEPADDPTPSWDGAGVVSGPIAPPPESARASSSGPDDAERRQITVVFCDLVGSTALSEALDPEDLRAVLRTYQQRAAAVIRRHRGHLAQFLGDGILAYFGDSGASERPAVDAVRAALEILAATAALQAELRLPMPLHARAGVHTGLVVLGEMGDAAAPQRLAVGVTPNVAARAQAEAPPGTALLTDATARLVSNDFALEDAGERQVKGVSRPIRFFRAAEGAPGRAGAVQVGAPAEAPLVGRDRELAEIEALLTPRDSGPAGVVLSGEPGIGKSRLVRELLGRLGAPAVVDCSATEHHDADAFAPLLRLLAAEASRAGPGGLA